MYLHYACLAVTCYLRRLQEFDPALKAHGEPPEFVSRWDDKLFSLAVTGFGRIAAPLHGRSLRHGNTLVDNFTGALEARSCRRNYQQTLDSFGRVLTDALEKHGEEAVLKVGNTVWELAAHGDALVAGMQKAGLTFSDAALVHDIFTKIKECRTAAQPGLALVQA